MVSRPLDASHGVGRPGYARATLLGCMRAPASDEAGSNQVAQRRARRPPVAVVVTHFNPRLGQRVEWQHPRDFVTEGVEFKVQHHTPSAHPLHARARPCAGANAPS